MFIQKRFTLWTWIMTSYLDTVIRTHVKNKERLATLDRMVKSWYDKRLNDLGDLIILDDSSPLADDVVDLALFYNATYKKANGSADTKNGLAESLLVPSKLPALLCVDDAVFGKGIKDRLILLLEEELPKLGLNWGIVGMFACYEEGTRNHYKIQGTSLWEVPNDILYALVGHIFSPKFSSIVAQRWSQVKSGEAEYPGMCDDIWVKQLLKEWGYMAYNTMEDYLQHTGMDNRTFGESGDNSSYTTNLFVGE